MRRFLKVSALISAIIFLAGISGWLYFCYFSADARYARDNLEYMTERMDELGIHELVNVREIRALEWPMPITVYKTAELADAWTKGYLSGIGEENLEKRDGKLNPYDTLARLILVGNNEDVQVIYENIQFDAGFCNPDTPVSNEVLNEWLSMKTGYAQATYEAYCNLLYTMFCLFCTGGVGWILFWVCMIVLYLTGRKGKISVLENDASEKSTIIGENKL
ncbi:MAG: hypothetical protein LUE86_10205 [Clostridiales bacterium]|nr:hypothetical protein [Clostridiales bacterium]